MDFFALHWWIKCDSVSAHVSALMGRFCGVRRRASPAMNREAGPLMKRENPTPGKAFWVLSSDEMQMTFVVPA
jgi:hypothetical protein